MWYQLKAWLLGWLFPIRCLGCQRYDTWLCHACLAGHTMITQLGYALGEYHYPPLQKAIHQLKYNGYSGAAAPLGQAMAKLVPTDSYDVVVPVPLHWRRYLERGYNQTALLAQHFPKPLTPILRKRKATRSQATLSRSERQSNLTEAFQVIPSLRAQIQGQRVLLIDDVFSTGATTQACTKQLLMAGASSVLIAVVAFNLCAE